MTNNQTLNKTRTLFKYNGEVIYSTDADLYQNEVEQLIRHVASTIYVKCDEIELAYELITETINPDKSILSITSDGKLIFDIGNNEFGVNFMENKPIEGVRFLSDLSCEEDVNKFLDRILDKTFYEDDLSFKI